jgi:hypothetical protein
MKRPSSREIDKRVGEAIKALQECKAYFANPIKVVDELMRLNIVETQEVWTLILELLSEIQIKDYAGHYPPQINYEPNGKGLELWAFCWYSKKMNKQMYLKFSIKKGIFYYVSLHESKFQS